MFHLTSILGPHTIALDASQGPEEVLGAALEALEVRTFVRTCVVCVLCCMCVYLRIWTHRQTDIHT